MYKGTINNSTVIIIYSKHQNYESVSNKKSFLKEKILDNMNLLVAEAMAEIEVPRERVKKE